MPADYRPAIAVPVITTSWDDGHPLDLRLAALLHKHGLPATFYLPLRSERASLNPAEIREIAAHFEVGGHTLTHCDLNSLPRAAVRREIAGCKAELEQITGRPCTSFCFPRGRFRPAHLDEVRRAGFTLARTVELMSFDPPRPAGGLLLAPTTVQAHATGWAAQARNSVKRLRLGNLLRAVRFRGAGWAAAVEPMLEHLLLRGGVFHLWGHSWEIAEADDWKSLEQVFACIAQVRKRTRFLNNRELRTF